MNPIMNFLHEEEGAVAIEYALLAALIALQSPPAPQCWEKIFAAYSTV